jgi:Ca2+-binding RTX toxin-like protein
LTRKVVVALSLAISGTAAFALLPAVAAGATAHIEIKRVYYIAGEGEENDISISLVGSNYVLTDPGAPITAGPGCTADGNRAVCPADGIIGITMNTGDQADSARNNTWTPSTLSGGDGNDSLQGGNGNDTLRGNRGLDVHSGGAGDDFIDTRGDRGDTVTCGVGNDFVNADSGDSIAADCEVVDRGDGSSPPAPPTSKPNPPGSHPSQSAARYLGPSETRKLNPGACATDISGTPGDDHLDGTALGDVLFGFSGNDLLEGLGGDDCIFGGGGSDRLSGGEGDDRLVGDETKGPGGNDQISGDSGNDLVVGGSGKDRLTGGDGSDRLKGNNGNDRLSGGAGNDRLSGGAGDDRLKGGPGRNRLSGGSGNDRLNGVNGRFDRLNCGSGVDSVKADRLDRVRGCERIHRR